MTRKTTLESLTRIKIMASPDVACCALRRKVGRTRSVRNSSESRHPRPGLRVIARSIGMANSRRDCAFRGRHTSRNATTRWFCPEAMNTISSDWLDLL